eukprot:COSAG06_NODE_4806_length_3937_cov_3.154647_2_plen_33_part_00
MLYYLFYHMSINASRSSGLCESTNIEAMPVQL